MLNNTRQYGARYESLAQRYLEQKGLKVITKNFNCRLGEIDLVLLDGKQVTFTEVRFRSSQAYGGSLESVTSFKQQKIIRAAQYFLLKNPKFYQYPCRFDVIAITPNPKGKHRVQWVKDAFQL